MPDEALIDAGIAMVRRFRAEDLEPLLVLADDAGVAANMRDIFPHPYTRADGEEWIARATGDHANGMFAIEVDGDFAGGVAVSPYKNEERITAEIGYWLGRPFWGRGIATAVVGALVPWAFEHLPEVLRLEACTYSSNPASGRVLEKNGFEFEGVKRRSVTKGDRILDQHIFALLRET